MAFRNTNSAESFEKIYEAFDKVNFTSYDFNTIKASLVDYTRIYFPEVFNDFTEGSEFIALLELFAYTAEQLAYRVDMVSHENFITTAQRKQSILRLAKLISYKATRNIPLRGLVKITSIQSTERIIDGRGTDVAGLVVGWNDPNNQNWKEQFLLIMNRVLTSRYGQPQKSFQVGDVVMDLYSLSSTTGSFKNGVYPFTASTGLDSYPMEIVPADIDENGPLEREPDLDAPMSIIFSNDGIGDGSDYTGFLGYVKQGTLSRIEYNILEKLPNRKLDFLPKNVNHTDVWVQKLNSNNELSERWKQVETINEQNLVFNDIRDTRLKYEVDTLENDQVSIIFGDGDFTDIPQGLFRFWMRQSANKSIVIQKNKVQNLPFTFTYISKNGNTETCTMTFSLTTTLQNGAASESIEHIRQSAPSTYYSQNRMVNGQDYNTYLLKDPSILRLKTVNRTFAGQPKYIDWNDASGEYENVKIFGDDLTMRYELGLNSLSTSTSGQALIDSVIEPLLETPGIINAILHISATNPYTAGVVTSPRRFFIEDNRASLFKQDNANYVKLIEGSSPDGSLKEKTAMQALIDRHWYGEPLEYVESSTGQIWARIPDPALFPKDDSKIYAANVPRTIDGVNKYPPGDIGSRLQSIAEQDNFALRYVPYMAGVGNGLITIHSDVANGVQGAIAGEVWSIEIGADAETFTVRSSERGAFPVGTVGRTYQITPTGYQDAQSFFTITQGSIQAFEPGDAFVLETPALNSAPVRRTFPWGQCINLNGWWEILGNAQLEHYSAGVHDGDELIFTNNETGPFPKQHSWLIFVHKVRQQPTNNVIGFEIHYRDLKLTVQSDNTKFWFNQVDQLLDSDTKKKVFDQVKILRSNLKSGSGTEVLGKSQVYDVVGAVKDQAGIIDFHKLQVTPTDLLQEDASGDLVSDRLLQFENFSKGEYEYFRLDAPSVILTGNVKDAAETAFLSAADGAFAVSEDGLAIEDLSKAYGRRQMVNNFGEGLDFMWQHFAPYTNIIDPSVTNIHDAFVITQGYYDQVISYLRGLTTSVPTPPSPLDLRSSYSYLLKNKMLSDTVVLHPGKFRLLFGNLAEPQFRAKFKVVRAPGAKLTNERVKEELLTVINKYFDISNWDFGETFYATELLSLMHQRLPTEIASVVLVPLYSMNSFGDMFTVECGFDEVLQSAAVLTDIEVVEALTSNVIRQIR